MESSSKPRHVMIVGAGLAGSLFACFMAKRGHRVSVYERRPDPRQSGFLGGRSINLALSARGLHGLRQVGLDQKVLEGVIPMRGRVMHGLDGGLTAQPYSKSPNDAIHSVSRGGLNLTCVEAAEEHDDVSFHFGQRCVDIDLDGATATFEDASGARVTVGADLIVGADGAFSAVRDRMQRTDRFNYQQRYLEHGYKELTIPPTSDGSFAMEPEALHIWPRGGYMMIALPNQDKSFTCTLFCPFTGPNGLDVGDDAASIVKYMTDRFPDAVPLMPTLVEDFRANPVSSLVTVRCAPWHAGGRVVLIGDAAHAIVPFYGQGINAGFEDCVALDECLRSHDDDWSAGVAAFSDGRVDDANAIADLALTNFVEMRDRVGSRLFLMRKKSEKLLHRFFPGLYTPLYNLVSFSTVPYAVARERARRQDRIVAGIALAVVAIVLIVLGMIVF